MTNIVVDVLLVVTVSQSELPGGLFLILVVYIIVACFLSSTYEIQVPWPTIDLRLSQFMRSVLDSLLRTSTSILV